MSDFAELRINVSEDWPTDASIEVYFPGISPTKKVVYTQVTQGNTTNNIAQTFLADADVVSRYTITSTTWQVVITANAKGIDWNFGSVIMSSDADGSYTLLNTAYNPIIASVSAITHVVGKYGDMTGAIAISLSGGYTPFIFLWEKAGDVGFTANTKNISGIGAGIYSLKITDDSGAVKRINNIEVTQPDQLVVVAEVDDSDVTVEVTGGWDPYTYSWSDGPTTKDRTGLEPGDYRLTVTDSKGFTAVALVIVGTDRFFFSKNPIPLELAADDPETKSNLSFNVEVWIEDDYLSAGFIKILEEALEQPADEAGETVFDVSAVLDANESLKMHVPAYNELDIKLAEGIFKRYYLKHAEKYGTPPVLQAFTQITTNFVYNGGLSYEEYASGEYFSSYFNRQHPFLTWQPTRKTVFRDQPEYLYFAVSSSLITEIRLRVTLHYNTGGQSVYLPTGKIKTGVNKYEVYCIPVGFDQLIFGSSIDSITWYEVEVVDQDENPVSEVRRYDIEQGYYPNRRYFLYQNSLGGSDTVVCVGQASDNFRTKSTEAVKSLPHDYNIADGEYLVVSKVGEQKLSLSTGYKSKEYVDRLKDFLISKQVYLIANNRYLPVIITSSYKDGEENNLHLIDIGVELPDVSSYTPFFNAKKVLPKVPYFSINVLPDGYFSGGETSNNYVLERDQVLVVYVNITRYFDFDEAVTLSIESGLPGDVNLIYMAPATTEKTLFFSLQADDTAVSKTYPITLKGVSESYPIGFRASFFLNVVINPDFDAPVFLVAPTIQNIGSRAYGLSGSINEDGQVRFYTVPSGHTPEPTILESGGFFGPKTLFHHEFLVSAGAWSFDFVEDVLSAGGYAKPLTPETDYDVYVYARDVQGNFQGEFVKLAVTTLPAPYFEVSIDEDSFVIEQGGSVNTLIHITRYNGYAGELRIMSSNGQAKITPSDVTSVDEAVLAININTAAPIRTFTIGIGVIEVGTENIISIPVTIEVVAPSVARVYVSNDYVEEDYVE